MNLCIRGVYISQLLSDEVHTHLNKRERPMPWELASYLQYSINFHRNRLKNYRFHLTLVRMSANVTHLKKKKIW